MSNNPPEVVLELTREQLKFLKKNCETNIAWGLSQLQNVQQEKTARALVSLMEDFKGVLNACKNAER